MSPRAMVLTGVVVTLAAGVTAAAWVTARRGVMPVRTAVFTTLTLATCAAPLTLIAAGVLDPGGTPMWVLACGAFALALALAISEHHRARVLDAAARADVERLTRMVTESSRDVTDTSD